MLVVCERWVGDGYRLLHIDQAVLLSHPDWAAQPWVTEGPNPSVCRWLSIRQLVSSWLQLQLTQAVCVQVIFLFDIHLLPLFFRLFTQVHIMINGSVEGQYVAVIRFLFKSQLPISNRDWIRKKHYIYKIYKYILIYIYHLSRKLYKLDEPDMLDTAGEAKTRS